MHLNFNDFEVTVMKNMRGGKNEVYIRKSPYLLDNMKMYAQITIPCGASIGMHSHTEDEEVITVIKGEGLLRINDQSYVIKQGDISLTKKNHFHSIENNNDEDLVLLAVINYLKEENL